MDAKRIAVKKTGSFRISRASAGLGAVLAFLSALILTSPATRAQSPASDSPVALKAELQPLSFFVGQWNCEGEFAASKKPIAAHIAITTDLDGSWLAFRWDDKAPNRFHALEMWGFDKTAKRFTNFIYDNFGGARLFNSAGWEADTLTWTGDMLATPPSLAERFVIERKSSKEFVISYDVRKSQTEWTSGDRLTCRQ
jgi:hypothetical protein